MSTRTRRIGTVLAAAAALATAIPAAFAAGTFTVIAGSASPGTVAQFTGTTTGTTPQIYFTDTTSNVSFTCDSGTAPGSITTGTGLSGTPIATINAAATTWVNCQFAGWNLIFTGSGTWALNTSSGSAAGASGNISNVSLTASGTGSFGTTCAFTISGSVPVSYTNATSTLAVNGGGLTISGVSGSCGSLGIIYNGDAATLQTSYDVSAQNATYNPIHITQP
jgi:hypothetical protein